MKELYKSTVLDRCGYIKKDQTEKSKGKYIQVTPLYSEERVFVSDNVKHQSCQNKAVCMLQICHVLTSVNKFRFLLLSLIVV